MDYNRGAERELGLFWERQFGQIIVPYGFSAQQTVPKGIDRIIWGGSGEKIHVQVRHKKSFLWSEFGECYGYEKYRLEKDMKIVTRGGIVLYVIHNYKRLGKYSKVNEIEDWVAQYINNLIASIDLERKGPTWFGDYTEKQIMPICYWHVGKFEPLDSILENWEK